MELNKKFDGNTKLCEWYKIILQNLGLIETEVGKKCSSADVEDIFAEKMNTSTETVEAVEALRREYGSVGSAAAAINELLNGRMRILSESGKALQELLTTANSIIEATDITGAPGGDTKGLLINGSLTSLWFSSAGEIYHRYSNGSWELISPKPVKRETILGVYTGDGNYDTERNIVLGFEPVFVRVMPQFLKPEYTNQSAPLGMTYAYKDCPSEKTGLQVTENGFKLTGYYLNSDGEKYLFEADKIGSITVVQ